MNPNPQIVINAVQPNNPAWTEGNGLLFKYFQLRETGNGYRLHVSEDEKIHTDPHHIELDMPFHFELNGLFWTVTLGQISPDTEGNLNAIGDWEARGPQGGTPDDGGGGDVETGTFQAQSGGHGTDELSATASA